MWNQQISKSLGNLFVEHLTAENKRLSDHDKNLYKNVTIKNTINRKMSISGTFFTLFLLVSGLTFFALFGDAYVKTAIAMHEFNEPDSTPSLQRIRATNLVIPRLATVLEARVMKIAILVSYENSDYGISMPVPAGWQEATPPEEEVDGLLIWFEPNTRGATLAISVFEPESGTRKRN